MVGIVELVPRAAQSAVLTLQMVLPFTGTIMLLTAHLETLGPSGRSPLSHLIHLLKAQRVGGRNF